jgi:UDP-galactopyranose mutase
MKRALVVGCGLSGAVIARELAEREYNVLILERRSHIGGNMYDHVDEHGIRVHDYGPHTFHTKKKELFDYMCCYSEWDDYKLTCGAEINGICTPTPFNFQTIDDFYDKQRAERLKKAIKEEFPGKETATVVEALESKQTLIHEYAQFLFDNDYSLYSAKQWGVSPSEIDPSILRRVPLRFNYDVGYFEDEYQVMPHDGYVAFFNRLLDHPNISVELNVDALQRIRIVENKIVSDGKVIEYPVIYTGPLDELFEHQYGELPYRSLRFEWVFENIDSKQNMPVVAYPQVPDFVRIIEYKKLPFQDVKGTTYEIEYSLPYMPGTKNEPYYPLLTDESQKLYGRYLKLLQLIPNIYVCGRLGDFKYYNMDQALERALSVCNEIINRESM